MHSKCHSRPLPTERIQLPPPGTPVKALMASLCAPRNQQHANFETKPHDIPKSSDVMVGSCLTICVLPPWLRSAWVMPHLLPRALQAREAAASAVKPLALHEVLDIAVRPGPKARTTPPTSPNHTPKLDKPCRKLFGRKLCLSGPKGDSGRRTWHRAGGVLSSPREKFTFHVGFLPDENLLFGL